MGAAARRARRSRPRHRAVAVRAELVGAPRRARGVPRRRLDGERLGPATETTFYRIAQEALNNVAKHATASRVDVIVERRDGEAVLVVEDDGVGFEPAEKDKGGAGMGLIGMRERAA